MWSQHAFGPSDETDATVAVLRSLDRALTSGQGHDQRTGRVWRQIDALTELRDTPLGLLSRCALLEDLRGVLGDEPYAALWLNTLQRAIAQLGGDDGPSVADNGVEPDGKLDLSAGKTPIDARLLVQGELPWRMGLLFRDVRGAGGRMRAGSAVLKHELCRTCDEDGVPHARWLARFPLVLAPLARAVLAGKSWQESPWDEGASARYGRLVRRAVALSHADGRTAMSNGVSAAPASLMRASCLAAGIGSREGASLRASTLGQGRRLLERSSGKSTRRRLRAAARTPSRRTTVSPSTQSDWAELICMRNNWGIGADAVVSTYHQSQPSLCLTAFDRTVLEGPWGLKAVIDGVPLPAETKWTCVCWFTDDDADYAELQAACGHATVLRQLLLSRADHWLYLADTISLPTAAELELQTRLPLSSGVKVEGDRWTRAARLCHQDLRVRVYPLGLEQKRTIRAHGSLEAETGELHLQQWTHGTALCAPLVLDWAPNRRSEAATWRQLTVGEEGRIVPRDAAVGYRLRVGGHQWMYFRSLHRTGVARTVLGHHTHCEAVIAEFTAEGDINPIVMVE